MALLDVSDCTVSFGGLIAVSGFSMHLDSDELVGLIGPNGAGKTTVFNLLTGIYKPDRGHIQFGGCSLVNLKPSRVCRLGIARTFQNIRLFGQMTVLENVRVAHYIYLNRGLWRSVLRTPSFYTEETRTYNDAMDLLRTVGLDRDMHEKAHALPYGKQRRLEIARALATKPKLLLLDEPAAGMNTSEKTDLVRFIGQVQRERKISILLIEHDMKVVMGICHRVIVMDHGEIIAEGNPGEIQNDGKVIEAYLGEKQGP